MTDGVEQHAVVIPVASGHVEPAVTYAVATSPRSAWADRQFLERQVLRAPGARSGR